MGRIRPFTSGCHFSYSNFNSAYSNETSAAGPRGIPPRRLPAPLCLKLKNSPKLAASKPEGCGRSERLAAPETAPAHPRKRLCRRRLACAVSAPAGLSRLRISFPWLGCRGASGRQLPGSQTQHGRLIENPSAASSCKCPSGQRRRATAAGTCAIIAIRTASTPLPVRVATPAPPER